LSGNVNAISLLKTHPSEIVWSRLASNPNAIQYPLEYHGVGGGMTSIYKNYT
jgi:hypothetical protein